MKKDFYIVSDEDSSVIFHKPTGMLAMLPDGCIPESERDFEMLEKKLENVPRISGHVKRHFGEATWAVLTALQVRVNTADAAASQHFLRKRCISKVFIKLFRITPRDSTGSPFSEESLY